MLEVKLALFIVPEVPEFDNSAFSIPDSAAEKARREDVSLELILMSEVVAAIIERTTVKATVIVRRIIKTACPL